MKRTLILSALFLLASCATNDDYDRRPPMRERSANRAIGVLEIMPPANWWRDDYIAGPVGLRVEQITALDKIGVEQGEAVVQLERDSAAAIRDVRAALDGDPAVTDDIVAAGDRLRTLRDTLFDREVRMIAAERQVLTRSQWQALEDQLRVRPQRERSNQYPGGGRGRGGRGGRRPGWPG